MTEFSRPLLMMEDSDEDSTRRGGLLVKPAGLKRFEEMIRGFAEYWLRTVALPETEDLTYAHQNV